MQIKVTRSKNRQRTISARLVDDVMMVYAPLRIPEAELEKAIDNLKKRLHKTKMRHDINKTQNLMEVAERFNREYFSEKLKIESIEYSTKWQRGLIQRMKEGIWMCITCKHDDAPATHSGSAARKICPTSTA